MATTTPNFGLRKPTNNDIVNVATDISGNMDLLDAHAHSGTYGSANFNVLAYGAVHDWDGTTGTNDLAAIQAAITAAQTYAAATGRRATVDFGPYAYYAPGILTITAPKVRLKGTATLVDTTVRLGLATGAYQQAFDFWCGPLTFYSTTDRTSGKNAFEAQRVWEIDLSATVIENYDAAVRVLAQNLGTGGERHVARVRIDGNRHRNVNYTIKIEKNLGASGAMAAADFTLTNCPFLYARDSHVYAEGLDGLVMSGNTAFFPSHVVSDAVKRYNVYVDVGQEINISDNNLFEAGLEAVLLSRCQYFVVEGNNIAFPGQRVYSDGIRVSGGDASAAVFNIGVIEGNTILYPTRRGISVEDNCGHISIGPNNIRDPGNLSWYYGSAGGAPTPYAVRADATTTEIHLMGPQGTGGAATVSVLGTLSSSFYSAGAGWVTPNGVTVGSIFSGGQVAASVFAYSNDTTRKILNSVGDPNGSISAGVGSTYTRADGGIATALYAKATGAGNTGWVPILAQAAPTAIPTPTALAANGASPPTPTLEAGSTDTHGTVLFGSGTGVAPGAQIRVTFSAAYGVTPRVLITADASTAMRIQVLNRTANYFDIAFDTSPPSSQPAGTWRIQYLAIPVGA
jgi:hypothetical protein